MTTIITFFKNLDPRKVLKDFPDCGKRYERTTTEPKYGECLWDCEEMPWNLSQFYWQNSIRDIKDVGHFKTYSMILISSGNQILCTGGGIQPTSRSMSLLLLRRNTCLSIIIRIYKASSFRILDIKYPLVIFLFIWSFIYLYFHNECPAIDIFVTMPMIPKDFSCLR